MRRRIRSDAMALCPTRLALFSLLALATPAAAQPSASLENAGLKIVAEIADTDGRPLSEVTPEAPFNVKVKFSDALTGTGVSGLTPAMWLRRTAVGKSVCAEAARAFRATNKLSLDDVPLAGLQLMRMDAQGRVATVDPRKSLSGSNMASLISLAEPASALVSHRDGHVLASLAGRGEVVRLDAAGRQSVLAKGLVRPMQLLDAPSGRLWVSETTGVRLLDADGATIVHRDHGEVAALLAAGDDRLVAAFISGKALALERGSGEVIAEIDTLPGGTIWGATASSLVQVSPTGLRVVYFDDPGRPREIALPDKVSGLAVDRNGKLAVAWSAGARTVHIVDLALLVRVHGFAATDAVDRGVIAGGGVFLTYRTRSVVTVISLALLKDGDAAQRDVRLAEWNDAEQAATLLTPLDATSQAIVGRVGAETLYLVNEGGGLATSPMSAFKIGRDAPVMLLAHERRLLEVQTGVFQAAASVHSPGPWEIVATTGVLGSSACMPLPVAGTAASESDPARLDIVVDQPIRQREPSIVKVRLLGEAPAYAELPLTAVAAEGGWMRTFRAARGADGAYHAEFTFPWPGVYPIHAATPSIAPATVEVE